MKIKNYLSLPEEIRLYEFQHKSLIRIFNYFEKKSNTNKSYLVTYPMGGGKSHLISLMAIIETGNVLVLSPSVAIKEQIIEKVKEFQKLNFGRSKHLFELKTIPKDDLDSELIVVYTYQMLYSKYAPNKDLEQTEYNSIKNIFSLVLIDEGHREPSPKWSFAIRDLHSNKVLFTATPYRNDFNIFKFESDATHIEAYCSLLKKHNNKHKPILRTVKQKQEYWLPGNIHEFLKIFTKYFDEICKDKKLKAIIRCKESDVIKAIVKILNATDSNIAIGIHSKFTNKDEKKGLFNSYKAVKASNFYPNIKIFVHQNMLIEGIDDKDLVLLALYDEFSNARSLIQQVGRILRYKSVNTAIVLSHIRSNVKDAWEDYIEFDNEINKRKQLWNIDRFTEDYLSNISLIMYENTEFKKILNIHNNNLNVFEALMFKKSANLYKLKRLVDFKNLIRILQESFSDTKIIHEIDKHVLKDKNQMISKINNFCIICYFSADNAEVFANTFFPEIKLGIAGIFRINDIIFYYCSDRRRALDLQDNNYITQITYHELTRLINKGSIFSLASLQNMDIRDNAIRQRIIRARNLNNCLTSNFDYSYYLKNTVYKSDANKYYLSFDKSRFSLVSDDMIGVYDYLTWLFSLQHILHIASDINLFIKNFAEAVVPSNELKPKNILLDLTQVEDYLDQTENNYYFIEFVNSIEKAYPIIYEDPKYSYFFINYHNQEIKIVVLSKKNGRFHLHFGEKSNEDDNISEYDSKNISLLKKYLGELNKRQVFILEFENTDFIYSCGHYFSVGNLNMLDSILREDPFIKIDWGEKDCDDDEIQHINKLRTIHAWKKNTLFKYITNYSSMSHEVLHRELKGIDFLVCDDRGGTAHEIADFIAICDQPGKKKIILMHCKSAKGKKIDAKALHEVTSQAIKNLQILNRFDVCTFKKGRFSKPYKVPNTKYVVDRMTHIKNKDCNEEKFISTFHKLRKDLSTEIEVWIVMAGGLDIKRLKSDHATNAYNLSCAKFLLYSTWASITSAGAKLKIFGPALDF